MFSRKGFVGTVVAALAVPEATNPAIAGTQAHSPSGLHAERPDLAAIFQRPAAHKQVVAVDGIRRGKPLAHITNSLNGYEFGFREGPGTLHIVGVLYGPGAYYGLNDAMWRKYPLASLIQTDGDSLGNTSAAEGNPFYASHVVAGDAIARGPGGVDSHDFSMSGLQRRGVDFVVCSNSLSAIARSLATERPLSQRVQDVLSRMMGRTPDEVAPEHAAFTRIRAELAANLIPGAVEVPAGVAVLNAAQEMGFTYLLG